MTFPVETLTDREVRRLLKACGTSTTGLRNRALLTLFYRGGLRCSEALALEPRDIDFDRGTINIRRGKGRRSRIIGIDSGALQVLGDWMARREKLGLSGRLFCTHKNTPLDTGYVRRTMKRLGRKTGIRKRVHPHGLRHTYACQLRREGVDVGIISRLLGHSNIRTTAIYLDHVNPQSAIDAGRGRNWSF